MQSPVECNPEFYIYQIFLFEKYEVDSGNLPIRVGHVTDEDGNKRKSAWEDYALINAFVVDNYLSDEQGTSLLHLFSNLLSRYNLKVYLPTTFRTIRLAMTRAMKDEYSMRRIEVDYPGDHFDHETTEKPFGKFFLIITAYLLILCFI